MSTPIKKQIIAIGGGGFHKHGKHSSDNISIEQYFLDQTGKERPKICFIPTASGESPQYIINFYQEFSQLACIPTHLSLFKPHTADLASFILEQDAIYVGGGNTKSMLALWRKWGIDTYLRQAWEQGIVLGGASAGSICWFEQGLTDSIPGPLTAEDIRELKTLGQLKENAAVNKYYISFKGVYSALGTKTIWVSLIERSPGTGQKLNKKTSTMKAVPCMKKLVKTIVVGVEGEDKTFSWHKISTSIDHEDSSNLAAREKLDSAKKKSVSFNTTINYQNAPVSQNSLDDLD